MVGPYAPMMVAWCLLAKGSRSVISLSLIPFCQMQETVSPRGGGGRIYHSVSEILPAFCSFLFSASVSSTSLHLRIAFSSVRLSGSNVLLVLCGRNVGLMTCSTVSFV